MATKKKESAEITVPALEIKIATLHIVGNKPLICHAMSQKAKLELLQNQQKKATKAAEARRPAVEFADSLYWLTEKPNLDNLTDEEAQKILSEVIPKSKFGFKSLAFKDAALTGSFQQGILAKNAGGSKLARTTARGAIRLEEEDLVEIEGDAPIIREDIAKIGSVSKVPSPRYRGEFRNWTVNLRFNYNSTVISLEQIVNLFNVGGFACGVGEWRPERGGIYGTFHVDSALIG